MPDGAPKATICALVLIAALGSCDNSSYELNHAMEICDRHHPLLPSTCPQVQTDAFGREPETCDAPIIYDQDKYISGWEMCSIVDQRWHAKQQEFRHDDDEDMARQHEEERRFIERYVGGRQ